MFKMSKIILRGMPKQVSGLINYKYLKKHVQLCNELDVSKMRAFPAKRRYFSWRESINDLL